MAFVLPCDRCSRPVLVDEERDGATCACRACGHRVDVEAAVARMNRERREAFVPSVARRPGPEGPRPDSPEPGRPWPRLDGWDAGALIRGRYRLTSYVGRGGMALVYRAVDLATTPAGDVALKVMFDPLNAHEDRFRREAEIGRAFRHPRFCRVHAFEQERHGHGRIFLAMEFIQGQTLSGAIQASGGFEAAEAAILTRDLALALHDFHAAGYIHRDLKPDNLMIRPDGSPVVMDFGLARDVEDDGVRITHHGFMGTPGFAAPEQIRDAFGADHRADIYSLGAIFYFLLCGRMPFSLRRGEHHVPLLRDPEPPSSSVDAFNRICLRAMARERDDRFATMAEFADALDRELHRPVEAVHALPDEPDTEFGSHSEADPLRLDDSEEFLAADAVLHSVAPITFIPSDDSIVRHDLEETAIWAPPRDIDEPEPASRSTDGGGPAGSPLGRRPRRIAATLAATAALGAGLGWLAWDRLGPSDAPADLPRREAPPQVVRVDPEPARESTPSPPVVVEPAVSIQPASPRPPEPFAPGRLGAGRNGAIRDAIARARRRPDGTWPDLDAAFALPAGLTEGERLEALGLRVALTWARGSVRDRARASDLAESLRSPVADLLARDGGEQAGRVRLAWCLARIAVGVEAPDAAEAYRSVLDDLDPLLKLDPTDRDLLAARGIALARRSGLIADDAGREALRADAIAALHASYRADPAAEPLATALSGIPLVVELGRLLSLDPDRSAAIALLDAHLDRYGDSAEIRAERDRILSTLDRP